MAASPPPARETTLIRNAPSSGSRFLRCCLSPSRDSTASTRFSAALLRGWTRWTELKRRRMTKITLAKEPPESPRRVANGGFTKRAPAAGGALLQRRPAPPHQSRQLGLEPGAEGSGRARACDRNRRCLYHRARQHVGFARGRGDDGGLGCDFSARDGGHQPTWAMSAHSGLSDMSVESPTWLNCAAWWISKAAY